MTGDHLFLMARLVVRRDLDIGSGMKIPRVWSIAVLSAATALIGAACSSTGPDIPTLYGKITATIGGTAWQSRPVFPDPPTDSTSIGFIGTNSNRLWIRGYGNSPPGGGVVEELTICVPAGAGVHAYSLGRPGAGAYGTWLPASTNPDSIVRYHSGAPAGTLVIEMFSQARDSIRGSFSFKAIEDSGTASLQITGHFYGRVYEMDDATLAEACQ